MDKTNHFQELKIFEDENMNIICDVVSNIVKQITGELPILCGSVAKVLSGILDENYKAKDVDFYLTDWNFRKLKNNFPLKIEGIRMIEKRPERIILYANRCIELWCNLEREENKKRIIQKKNNKIPYINYGN